MHFNSGRIRHERSLQFHFAAESSGEIEHVSQADCHVAGAHVIQKKKKIQYIINKDRMI